MCIHQNRDSLVRWYIVTMPSYCNIRWVSKTKKKWYTIWDQIVDINKIPREFWFPFAFYRLLIFCCCWHSRFVYVVMILMMMTMLMVVIVYLLQKKSDDHFYSNNIFLLPFIDSAYGKKYLQSTNMVWCAII